MQVTETKPRNLMKVWLGAGFSLVLIIFGYYASRLFPGINTDAIEAIVGIGSLFSTLWGLKASGLLKPFYFWLAVSMVVIAPTLAYVAKNI